MNDEYNEIVDNNNNVEFKNIPIGKYTILIDDNNYEKYTKPITINKNTPNPYEINILLETSMTIGEITANIDYTNIWYPTLTTTLTNKTNNPLENKNVTVTIGENTPITLTTDSEGQITTKIKETEPTTITISSDNITKTIEFTPKTRTIEYTYLVNDGDGRTCAYFIDTTNTNSYVGYNNNSDPAFLMNTTSNQKIESSDLTYTLPYNEKTPVTITYNAKEITYKFRGRTNNNENIVTLTLINQDMSNYRLAFKAVRTVKLYNFKIDGIISTEAQNSNNWSGNISVTTDNNDTYIAISGNTNCILNTLH